MRRINGENDLSKLIESLQIDGRARNFGEHFYVNPFPTHNHSNVTFTL